MKRAKATLYLDKRRATKNDTYPIKIKVYYDGHRKYYGIDTFATIEEYSNKIFVATPKGKYKTIQKILKAEEKRATDIIDGLDEFSFLQFENKFIKKKKGLDSRLVSEHFQLYINELKKQDRISSAESYDLAQKSFTKYIISKNPKSSFKQLRFGDIDRIWLEDYETWMLSLKKTSGTVGVYTRNLRTLFNRAISNGTIDRSLYPFGKWKYLIPNVRNKKRAISLDELQRIYNFPCTNSRDMKKYIDYFLFSFYVSGINLKDMGLLTWADLNRDRVSFVRAKTKRSTKSERSLIDIPLNKDAKRIIKDHGVPSPNSNDFIFPIFNSSMTALEKEKRKKQQLKNINKWLKYISKATGIDSPESISFSVARHSWASIAKQKGVSKLDIQEMLGHKNSITTDKYLKSLDEDNLVEFQNDVIDLSNLTKLKSA